MKTPSHCTDSETANRLSGAGVGSDRVEHAIREANSTGRPAIAAFLTAGYPTPERFDTALMEVASVVDVLEIGVPFSDPMADGVTIQRSSRVALEAGVTLSWILERVRHAAPGPPLVLMSYLNPILAFGTERLTHELATAGIDGIIVPDLPYEECLPVRGVLDESGLALIQLVTPVTPGERLRTICAASRGFVYAVTVTGTTGGEASRGGDAMSYLDCVRSASDLPVLAGFGIRSARQVRSLAKHADGVIVGSALIETLERGDDPVSFLRELQADVIESTTDR